MAYPLAQAQLLDWENLSLDEAWAMRHRWDETRQDRLDWLAAASGLELVDREEIFLAVWRWLCNWVHSPSTFESAPKPVWWAPPVVDTLPYRQRVGVEAVVTYLEEIAWTRCPEFVPAVSVYPKGRKSVVEPHRPCLALVPEPETGPDWPTAHTVTVIARFIARDELETRGTRWYSSEYEGISQWIATARKEHAKRLKKKTSASSGIKIARIPREEAEQLGGFQWDVSFDEGFGHDHQDAVSAYASALEVLDGVDDVEHYDRGMIRIAGTVSVTALRTWSREWLNKNADTP